MFLARPRSAVFLLLALALCAGVSRAQEEPGTVLNAWTDSITGNDDAARCMALYPDGGFVAVGAGIPPTGTWDSVIVRYHADGTRDTGFGGYGTGARIQAWSATGNDSLQCLALRSDGRVLAAGQIHGAVKNTLSDCFVVRYLSDGTPDPSFGTGGRSVFLASKANDRCFDLAIQSNDGKIVLVGMGNPAATKGRNPSPDRTIVARLLPNGVLDTTFASGGVASLTIGSGSSGAGAVAIQPDGKIVVGGDAAGSLFILRLNPNGTLDSSFGGGGIRLVTIPGARMISGVGGCLRLQDDGKIVLGGYEKEGIDVASMTLVRLNPNGSLDITFNSTGIQASAVPSELTSLTLDPAGRILACGAGYVDGVWGMVVARFTAGGQLDATFNASGATPGYVHRSHIMTGGGYAWTILYRPGDNSILVGGRGDTPGGSLFGYLRIRN